MAVQLVPSSVNDFSYSPRAIIWTLNALGDKDTISVSVFAGAKVTAFRRDVIGYDPANNYRAWAIIGYNTHFESASAKYAHIAIAKDGDLATIVYPDTRLDIFGRSISDDGTTLLLDGKSYTLQKVEMPVEGGEEGQVVSVEKWLADDNSEAVLPEEDPSFLFLYLGKISDSYSGAREWVQTPLCGNLDTDQYRNEEKLGEWDKMFYLNQLNNTIVQRLPFLRILLGLDNKEITDLWRSTDTIPEDADKDKVIPSVAYAEKAFLSKLNDDIASGLITFLRGFIAKDNVLLEKLVTVCSSLISNNFDKIAESGFGIVRGEGGDYSMFIKNLTIWGKAIFNELEIRKLTYVNGCFVFSPAGSKLLDVWEIDEDGNLCAESGKPLMGWRCTMMTDDGTTATTNSWDVDDQVKCQEFNIREGIYQNVSNTYYWRKIVRKGYLPGTNTAYIDISLGDCDRSTVNDAPKKGDTIVCMGNRTNRDRQNIIIVNTIGEPYIAMYANVNTYHLGEFEVDGITYNNQSAVISPMMVHFSTQVFKITDWKGVPQDITVYKGDFDPDKADYGYGDEVTWDGVLYVAVYPYSPYPAGSIPGTIGADGIVYWKEKVKPKEAKVYDAYISDYADNIVVDVDGNCVGGLYEVFGGGRRQYRLHSAIFATRNGEPLLYQQVEDGAKPDKNCYAIRYTADGCTAILRDGTIYITSIDHVRDGISGTGDDLGDFNYDAMRGVHQCRVLVTVTFEDGSEKYIEMPVTVNHIETSYITADIDNEMFTWSWSESQKQLYGGTYVGRMRCHHDNELLTEYDGYSASFEGGTPAGLSLETTIVTLREGQTEETLAAPGYIETEEIRKRPIADRYVKVTVTPLDNEANDIADGTFRLAVYANVRKAGIGYEKVVYATLGKDSKGAAYDLVPSAMEVLATYGEDGRWVYSPAYGDITCDVNVRDDRGLHVVGEADLAAYGLTLRRSVTGFNDETKELVFELLYGEHVVDREALPIVRQANGIVDTDIDYGVSESTDPATVTTWYNLMPSREGNLGKYLHTRVRYTFANGDVKTSYTYTLFNENGQSAFKSTVFKRALSITAAPTGGSYASPVPSDRTWSDGIPAEDASGNPCWFSSRVFTSDGKSPQQSTWTTPQICADTADMDVCFSAQEECREDKLPNPGSNIENAYWHNTATENDIWMAISRMRNGVWSSWDVMKIKGEKGEKGDKGQSTFKSIVFKRSASKPNKPTDGSYSYPVPSGWSDGIPNETNGYPCWMSTRVFSSDGLSPQQSAWTDVQLAIDTSDFDVCFSAYETCYTSRLPNPGSNTENTYWHNVGTEDDIWMATSTCSNGKWSDWSVNKIKGEKGDDGNEGRSAFQLSYSPTAIVFETNSRTGAVVLSGNTITFSAKYKDSNATISLGSLTTSNCTASKSGSTATINSVSNVTKTVGSKSFTLPATDGYVSVPVTMSYGGNSATQTITIPFRVEVAYKFAECINTLDEFSNTIGVYTEKVDEAGNEIATVKSTTSSLTADVASLRADYTSLNTKTGQLETAVSEIRVTVNGISIENIKRDVTNDITTKYAALGIADGGIYGVAEKFALYTKLPSGTTIADVISRPSSYNNYRAMYWDNSTNNWVFNGKINAEGGTIGGITINENSLGTSNLTGTSYGETGSSIKISLEDGIKTMYRLGYENYQYAEFGAKTGCYVSQNMASTSQLCGLRSFVHNTSYPSNGSALIAEGNINLYCFDNEKITINGAKGGVFLTNPCMKVTKKSSSFTSVTLEDTFVIYTGSSSKTISFPSNPPTGKMMIFKSQGGNLTLSGSMYDSKSGSTTSSKDIGNQLTIAFFDGSYWNIIRDS